MSSKHDQAHREILQRLAALEAGVTPPTPTPPPAPEPPAPPPAALLDTLDFTDAGNLPSGVSVVRSGSTATRRTGANTVEIMAANTARYEYGSDGALRGLLCEKARTNLVANGRNIASGFTNLGANVTVDDNYAGIAAPNGANEATRLTTPTGSGYHGKRLGIASVNQPRRVQVWARGTSAAQQLTLRNPDTNDPTSVAAPAAWSLVELFGDMTLPSNYYNYDLVNGNGSATLDILVWGADLGMMSEDREDTLIATSGSTSTRPKEVITVTFSEASINGDIQITFDDGDKQNFLSQAINSSGEWTIDADNLNGRIIAQIDLYEEGELPEDPSAPPPSAPPPVSTVEIQNAINDMILQQEAGRANGSINGLYQGIYVPSYASLVQMCAGQYNFPSKVDCILPWVWVWQASGHAASNTRVALRYMRVYICLDSKDGDWVEYEIAPRLRGYVNSNVYPISNDMGDQTWHNDGITTSVRPGIDSAIELWPWDGVGGAFSFPELDNALMQRIVGVYIDVETELQLHNGGGTDDRHLAKFIVAQGYDFYSRQNQINGIYGRPQDGVYPVHAMDGGFGRYKLARTTPQRHSVSPLKSWITVGSPPPWGNYNQPWPYQYSPYTWTQDEFRANPPPVLV